ncbi:VOC family protein [Maribacter halichondriae]|uniref:VOC family protein n=1 Tax=Maribacter halichondriae TaxID=2980554 RepID=UPI002359FD3B|nr:VOC family protein [Maribacter sp. Hal144]
MSSPYKPDGYNSLSPYFVIEDVQKFIDLLQQIFDAEELRRYHRPDGSIMHVELRIDDTVIMIGGATKVYTPIQQMVHLYVQDVDATFEKALRLGCKPIQEPEKKESDDDKRGGFTDFAGNSWWIATQLA